MTTAEKHAYRSGFRAGESGNDLDVAEVNWLNHPQYHSWMDGYMDAANREFGHLPNCLEHERCG